jgi:4-amino-4-deoxy-L-arabinose transferase-like glycosyltransferase
LTSRLKIWHLVPIFMLAALPFAATFAIPYPDERHYTDGAMGMLRDHDWLVPKAPDGQPRFNKPPFAYWTTAASFAAFGVNPLAARLPFLLASCGAIFMTWRLARKLTGDENTALLAALILATHVQFFLAAVRSIPDAWLCLFILLSAEGFLRLIVFEEFTAGAFWLAYGGAALATMDKGLLGLAIVLFAWMFAGAGKRSPGAIKKLWHWPSMTVAGLFVTVWFYLILKLWGGSSWRVFFGDQVTDNVQGHWWAPLGRLPVFALILAVNFLPWSLPALEAWLRKKWTPSSSRLNPLARNFIIAWCAVLVVGFALGVNISVRYLLPAAPLGAILVAEILAGGDDRALFFSTRRILKFILGLDLLLCAAALAINAQWDLSAAEFLAADLFILVVVMLGLGALARGWFSMVEGLGLALILIFPLLFLAVNRVRLPDPCQQMAMMVRQTGVAPGKPVLFVGRPALASGVRLFLEGKCRIVRTDTLAEAPDHLADYAMVLVPEPDVAALEQMDYQLRGVTSIPGQPPLRAWWPLLKTRGLPEALEQYGRKYFLMTPGNRTRF